MSRKVAREDAFKILFESLFHDKTAEELLSYYTEQTKDAEGYHRVTSPEDEAYIRTVVAGVLEKKDELDERIQACSKSWEMSRQSKVSIALLRLALYEMLYMEDIPVSVSISEAVNLAKKYDTEKVKGFVNGVLGNIGKGLS